MTTIDTVPVARTADGLLVIDTMARTYIAASHDGSYYHHVAPARGWEWLVRQGIAKVGDLICDCQGASNHGRCYRVDQAELLESDLFWRDQTPVAADAEHPLPASQAIDPREAPVGVPAPEGTGASRTRSRARATVEAPA